LVTLKSCGKTPKRAARRIGRIAEWWHTAIAIYINGMGYLKVLDAGERRFALSGDVCSKIEDVKTFERY
jgi:sRNA-binding protein